MRELTLHGNSELGHQPTGSKGGIACLPEDSISTKIVEFLNSWNDLEAIAYTLMDLPLKAPTQMTVKDVRGAFPTVDVPDHAHYTIGTVILIVGITGTLGNFLVIYAFCRSRTLQKPANIFIINLAVSDFLMSITQSPVFFTNSLHKRWIFGEKGCELYAFCGALFGITSMITLMVIALDRYFVITKPLASVRVMSKKKALIILVGVWLYSLAWSLPPFFGWSAYVPEGLLTSCSWDYMTFTPSVRAYTMLLFCFVFFIPLIAIIYSYVFIFEAIKKANKSIQTFGCKHGNKEFQKQYHRMKNEWKLAKIALIIILLYVISWSPYSVVALVAFAGYSHVLTPFMNSIPAVIAKASAIHNPIIYAITHPKYREFFKVIVALDETRYAVYYNSSRKGEEQSKIEGQHTVVDTDEISMVELNVTDYSTTSTCKTSEKCSVEEIQGGESQSGIGLRNGESHHRPSTSQIPSIIITYSSVQGVELPSEYSTGLLYPKNKSHRQNKSSNS
ncbi:UNVERIFIED_CONTAM: hypothetical protein H355_011109 [Colinus virginianus]|nr:hypothetical protein H355_011109 [Colinus virginianus]